MDFVSDPIELHMIGDWPEWDAGIHTIVHHGVVREKTKVMALLDACDVLLMPSLSEGMPTVILEAFARGLEVIASDVGACSEMIDRKMLIPPADTELLSLAIQEGSAACARYPLERFAFEAIARNTLVEIQKTN
jgi:glycosyltransferase involved in cell wall biosynthesis